MHHLLQKVQTVAKLYDKFHLTLGREQYVDGIISFKKRLFAMFHRSTADENKNFILDEFKRPDSSVRVVIATSSFEMGLDFPDFSDVINYSAPRSLELFAQQCGCGGRSIPQAFSLVYWQGVSKKQSSATTKEMREYALSTSCRRQQLKEYFTLDIEADRDISFEVSQAQPEGCKCCDQYKSMCSCGSCMVPPWKKGTDMQIQKVLTWN